jgi:hypothetical protein
MLETWERRVLRRRRASKPRGSARAREVQIACARCVARHAPRCASASTANAHLLAPRAIRYCVRFRTLLYSRKLLVIRTGSTEPRARVNEKHGRRGYCVGSPRTGLLTTTPSLAAASASRAVAPFASATRYIARRSPVIGTPLPHRTIVRIARTSCVAPAARPLLHARPGRHALDEVGGSAPHRSTSRCIADVAVKNLRIVGSTVLLLNFHEVRALHLCSTGVTM